MVFNNMGKMFEKEFESSLQRSPLDFFYKREKDDMGMMRGVFNIYDFLIFHDGDLFLLELKSVKGGTLPFVNVGEKKKVRGSEQVEIQFKRLQKLTDWARVSGVQAGFLVEFRKVGEVYYIPAEKMWEMVQGRSNGRKSVDVKYCQENFPQVQRALIKVHHNYNITALLREILEFGGEKCAES